MIYFYIFFAALVLVITSTLKSKRICNPINIIGLIWLILLTISLTSLGGIDPPSHTTGYIVASSCMFMAAGGVFAYSGKQRSDKIYEQNKTYINLIFLLLCVIPIGFAFINFLLILLKSGYAQYLYISRINEVDRTVSAGSAFNSMFLAKITRPTLYFYTFLSIAKLIIENDKKMVIRAFLALIIMSVIFTSRADALLFIITILLYTATSTNKIKITNNKVSKKSNKIIAILLIIVIALLSWISSLRAGGKSAYELIMHYIINYHTVGFTLFDIAYQDKQSFFYRIDSHGLVTFSTVDFVLQQFNKLLPLNYSSPALEFRDSASIPVEVGYFMGVQDLYSLNAFYTFMGPVFTDFGVVGIYTFSSIYGYFLMSSYLSVLKNSTLYSLSLLLFLLWTGYNGLLQSAISTDYWWTILLLLLFFLRIQISTKKPSR